MAPPAGDQERLLTVEEARARILDALALLPVEAVPLAAAFGRVLARPVAARDAAPPFDASEMDGWAVRAADVACATDERPAVLPVAFEVHAGSPPPGPLPPASASWIATGAPLPEGADAVIPREWTRRLDGDTGGPGGGGPGGARVAIARPPDGPGAFIRRRGDDWSAGEEVLAPGERLTPGRVALAASCGAAALEVRRRPRVAIVATGDELLEPGAPLRPGAIRESNRLLLAGMVAAAGGEPVVLGIVPDEREATIRALEEALRYDVAITAGGASVGERDLVRGALEALGAPPRFWRVAVKPGKPFAFAVRPPSPVFVLPGNPAAALVCFHLFVAPALRFLAGVPAERAAPAALEATLEAPVRGAPDRRTYLRAVLRAAGGGLTVRAASRQASGSVRSLAEANALIVVPEGAPLEAGARVRVEPVEWGNSQFPVPNSQFPGPSSETGNRELGTEN